MIDKDIYSMIHSLMPIACVDVVVRHEDRILLVKRKEEPMAGRWWIPGGRLLREETAFAAVTRLVQTETGLSVRNPRFVHFMDLRFGEEPFGHRLGTRTVSLVFEAHSYTDSYKLDNNHLDALWWDGFGDLDLHPTLCGVLAQTIPLVSTVRNIGQ